MKHGRPPHDDLLTPAEWRVTELVRHGLSTSAFARTLGISHDGTRTLARTATAKLGLSRRAARGHWPGIRKGSLRPTYEEERQMNLGPVSQISRRVETLDRARTFLSGTVGLTELYAFPGLAFFDLGGTRLMLRETGRHEEADILYFRVENIAAARAALTERGATFSGPPHMIHRHPDGTEEWMAFFKDDEGRDLALHMQARP